MNISIDFDGTCLSHEYPELGEEIGAAPVLRKLVEHGHELILSSERSGIALMEALNWFERNEITIKSVQINPEQRAWTSSQKTVADLYIDDKGIGVPTKTNLAFCKHPYIDWKALEEILTKEGILK